MNSVTHRLINFSQTNHQLMIGRLFLSSKKLFASTLRFHFTLITQQNFQTAQNKFIQAKSITDVNEYVRYENTFVLTEIFSKISLDNHIVFAALLQLQKPLEQNLPDFAEEFAQVHSYKFDILLEQNKIKEADKEYEKVIEIANKFQLNAKDMLFRIKTALYKKMKQENSAEAISKLKELCDSVDLSKELQLINKQEMEIKEFYKATLIIKAAAQAYNQLCGMYLKAELMFEATKSILKVLELCQELPLIILRNYGLFYMSSRTSFLLCAKIGDNQRALFIARLGFDVFTEWPQAREIDKNLNYSYRLLFLSGMMTFEVGEKQQEYAHMLAKLLKEYEEIHGACKRAELINNSFINTGMLEQLMMND